MPALLNPSKGQPEEGSPIQGIPSEGQVLQVYPWSEARLTTEGHIDGPYHLCSEQNCYHRVGWLLLAGFHEELKKSLFAAGMVCISIIYTLSFSALYIKP